MGHRALLGNYFGALHAKLSGLPHGSVLGSRDKHSGGVSLSGKPAEGSWLLGMEGHRRIQEE